MPSTSRNVCCGVHGQDEDAGHAGAGGLRRRARPPGRGARARGARDGRAADGEDGHHARRGGPAHHARAAGRRAPGFGDRDVHGLRSDLDRARAGRGRVTDVPRGLGGVRRDRASQHRGGRVERPRRDRARPGRRGAAGDARGADVRLRVHRRRQEGLSDLLRPRPAPARRRAGCCCSTTCFWEATSCRRATTAPGSCTSSTIG